MAEASSAPAREDDDPSAGLALRALRAIEQLAAAQVATAKREARKDAARVIAGIVLGLSAIGLFAAALALGQVAAVFLVQARFGLSWPLALLSVAGGDAALAALLYVLARRRLSPPVLAETRAMARRAAAVIAGASR